MEMLNYLADTKDTWISYMIAVLKNDEDNNKYVAMFEGYSKK